MCRNMSRIFTYAHVSTGCSGKNFIWSFGCGLLMCKMGVSHPVIESIFLLVLFALESVLPTLLSARGTRALIHLAFSLMFFVVFEWRMRFPKKCKYFSKNVLGFHEKLFCLKIVGYELILCFEVSNQRMVN